MARMHSGGKGRSGSSKPSVSEAPAWSATDKKEVEDLIVSLAQEGHSTSVIGTLLRDQHAVPDARLVMGERISQTLARNGISPRYPEDMMNLMRRALGLIDHLAGNSSSASRRSAASLGTTRAPVNSMRVGPTSAISCD